MSSTFATKLACAAMLVVPASGAVAQAQANAGKRAFIAITVPDLAASVRWYADNLGAREVSRSKAPSGIAENVNIMSDDLLVELIHFADRVASDTAIRDPRALGIKKAGVWLDSAAYARTLKRLRERNARFLGGEFGDERLGVRTFIVRDTSGTLIQFFRRD